MKSNVHALCFVMLLLFAVQAIAQQTPSARSFNAQYDQSGRIIRSADGNSLNYKTTLSVPDAGNAYKFSGTDSEKLSGIIPGSCEPVWRQSIMGTCIGSNAMISMDIDYDGQTEIICSAGSGYSSGFFWYILRYMPQSASYEHLWVSDMRPAFYSGAISVIAAFDTDHNDIAEIYVGMVDGTVEVYDGATYQLIVTIPSETYETVSRILFDDADNDNVNELVLCKSEKTYLLNSADYSVEQVLDYASQDVRCGNVDNEPSRELVYSDGMVIRVNGNSSAEIWNYFDPQNDYGFVGLTDVDGDGMDEIVRAHSWSSIDIFDADIQALKYEIPTSQDIGALLLNDVNNDGRSEILYGDGQWGEVHCHNASDGELMWSVENPEHGTTEINVADTDNDGELELMWGGGCSSSGPDFMFVHDLASLESEWQSKHLDGPFDALCVADADNDGQQELVTVSSESNSGYDSGILSIFNASTHQLEWQSESDFFSYGSPGMYAMKIADIDQNNANEIIVASGGFSSGKIWVIDGITHEMKDSHEFYDQNMGAIFALEIADVDDDGQLEYIAVTQKKVYIINPSGYSIEWNTADLYSATPSNVLVDNIDAGPNKEIVSCKGKIIVIDGLTHQQWETTETFFSAIDLYDFNNDGTKDIVGATTNGTIGIIDGQTHGISWLDLDLGAPIDGIRLADIFGDADPEFIFTMEGTVFFSNLNFNMLQSVSLGETAGKFDALVISDYDNNGRKEIFAGSDYQVAELGYDCYKCVNFVAALSGDDVSCSAENDGSAQVTASGGSAPYSYLWDFGGTQAQATDLTPGTYQVTVTDAQGCNLTGEISIVKSSLLAMPTHTDAGCSANGNGSAGVIIYSGHEPYSYLWSNGSTSPSISNIAAGEYSVTVTDSKSCTQAFTIPVVQDSVGVELMVHNISCGNMEPGYIETHITSGQEPFTYNWSTGATTPHIYDLMEGTYTLTVVDQLLCSKTVSAEIIRTEQITAITQTTTDNPDTPEVEGSATIFPSGGQPPYFIQWYDPLYQTSPTAIYLYPGEYQVRVSDANNCTAYFTVFVGETNGLTDAENKQGFRIYPVPASSTLVLETRNATGPIQALATVLGAQGQTIMEIQVTDHKTAINIDHLVPGFYMLRLTGSNYNGIQRFTKH